MRSEEQPSLIKCPFCGGSAELRQISWTMVDAEYMVSCTKCFASTDWSERSKAINAWEKRV